jgi:hypothetical protein
MRLQDVKVGDVVTLKEWSGTIRLNGGSYLEWSAAYAGFVNKVFRIDLVDRDGSVRLAFPDGSYLWWPVAYCAPPAHQNPFKLGDYAVAPSGATDTVVGLSDTTVLLRNLGWYPAESLRPVEFKHRATAKRDTQQALAAADEALALALRYQKQLEDDLADERRTTAELRKQVADLTTLTTSLEKQVIELRAEVQKVGKQRQSGSRFALLELD